MTMTIENLWFKKKSFQGGHDNKPLDHKIKKTMIGHILMVQS
jgi:hypothetical protein